MRIRDVLGQNGIDYSVKTGGRNGGLAMGNARAHLGTLGENLSFSYEYIFYVKRSDYERALACLNGTLHR